MKQTLLCVFLALMSWTAKLEADEFLSGVSAEILPVEMAFRFGYSEAPKSISLFWEVQPGYFLYRDKISVSVNGELKEIDLPSGEWHLDETFGRVKVLEGFVSIEVSSTKTEVSVRYQGCAEKGYCYPPQIKSLNSRKTELKSKNLNFSREALQEN